MTINQSCNGLLLCWASYDGYVYNPTTKQYKKLPRLQSRRSFAIHDMVLAFDPLISPHFKVVCVWANHIKNAYRIEIYSSQGGAWKRSARPFNFSLRYTFANIPGVYWNGAVHWVNVWEHSFYFKIEEEQLCTMPMLRPPLEHRLDCIHLPKYRYFGESRDHLYLVDYMFEPDETHLNIFEMKRDYSKWDFKFRVDLAQIANVFPEMILRSSMNRPQLDLRDYNFSVLCFVRGEREEDSFLVLNIPGKVLRYNFGNKTFYKLCDIDSSLKLLHLYDVYRYIKTLACVCGGESKRVLRSHKSRK